MNDRTGQQFGEYRLIRLIGRGGFSHVYLGEDSRSKAQVAVKIFSQPLVNSNDIANFLNELRSLLRLKHPHILQILDLGVVDDISYLVMAYAPNGTLADRHRKNTTVPLETILSYVKQIASALQYAHDQRIIHRDVKPQNMLIGSNNEILLSDFGIATIANDSGNQQTGVALGTPRYMAPEQFQGKAQFASDQYALGLTVYEWLSGDVPYVGNIQEILYQHMSATPASLRAKMPTISPKVEAVVLKALSKNPRDRYARVMDFADALEQAIQPTYSQSSDAAPDGSTDSFQEQPPTEIQESVESSTSVTLPTLQTELEAFKQSIIPVAPPQIQQRAESPVSSTQLFTQTGPSQSDLSDFFIIYTKADRKWARWVSWELEDARYSVVLPPWYIHAQTDFDMEMEKAAVKAKRIVLILSPDSLLILKAQPAHIIMLLRELKNNQNKLLSICVRECGSEHEQLLDSLQHIDIAGEDELTARAILLASVLDAGITLKIQPAFPDILIRRSTNTEPAFPPDNPTITQEQISVATSLNTITLSTLPSSLPDIEIFFSYSHEDKKLRNELEKFMSHLKKHPAIKSWHDSEIGAGMTWAQEIDKHLNKANIILLLVSQDFIASDYCYNIEMQKAIQRHEAGEARVIPIILHPSFWRETPLGNLQVLPKGTKPVTEWPNRKRAWMDVVEGIQQAIMRLASSIQA